jgi:hypothetical protein
MVWSSQIEFVYLGINKARKINKLKIDKMVKLEITKEQFAAYVRVQMSGVTNMFDVRNVTALTGLNKKQIMEIMTSYGELEEKYS